MIAGSTVALAIALAMPLPEPSFLEDARASTKIAEALDRWERSMVIVGEGIMQSESFWLDDGDYIVSWQAADSPCYNGLHLYSDADGNRIGTIAMTKVHSTANGYVRFYDITRGPYYIDAASGCRWSVRLMARS